MNGFQIIDFDGGDVFASKSDLSTGVGVSRFRVMRSNFGSSAWVANPFVGSSVGGCASSRVVSMEVGEYLWWGEGRCGGCFDMSLASLLWEGVSLLPVVGFAGVVGWSEAIFSSVEINGPELGFASCGLNGPQLF